MLLRIDEGNYRRATEAGVAEERAWEGEYRPRWRCADLGLMGDGCLATLQRHVFFVLPIHLNHLSEDHLFAVTDFEEIAACADIL